MTLAYTVISERGAILIRRQMLNSGAATPWHTDLRDRFTVVVRGEQIAIAFRKSGDHIPVPVYPGLAEWDRPFPRCTGPSTPARCPTRKWSFITGADLAPEHP